MVRARVLTSCRRVKVPPEGQVKVLRPAVKAALISASLSPSSWEAFSSPTRLRRLARQVASRLRSNWLANSGMAMAIRMAMMATTISISIRVKPRFFLISDTCFPSAAKWDDCKNVVS